MWLQGLCLSCSLLFVILFSIYLLSRKKEEGRKKRRKEEKVEEGREEWRRGKERNQLFEVRSNTSYVLETFYFNSSSKDLPWNINILVVLCKDVNALCYALSLLDFLCLWYRGVCWQTDNSVIHSSVITLHVKMETQKNLFGTFIFKNILNSFIIL